MYILFDNVYFVNFINLLDIDRSYNAYYTNNPVSINVEIFNSYFMNSIADYSNFSDSLVFDIYNFYIENNTFSHSYINLELARIYDNEQTVNNKILVNDDLVHFGIENCYFRNFETHSALVDLILNYILQILQYIIIIVLLYLLYLNDSRNNSLLGSNIFMEYSQTLP